MFSLFINHLRGTCGQADFAELSQVTIVIQPWSN